MIDKSKPLELGKEIHHKHKDASGSISQSTGGQKKGASRKFPIWCKIPKNSEVSLQV